jgi:tetratricopeptide (TPR) repeat protein
MIWGRHVRFGAVLSPVVRGISLVIFPVVWVVAIIVLPHSALAAKPKAEGGLELLRAGHSALKQKRFAPAVEALSTALKSGTLKPTEMSKALYYRGIAYRSLGQPAMAIADFSNALWLKGGLSPSERADAEQQRAAAYAEAAGGGQSAPSPVAARSQAGSSKQPPGGWQTSTVKAGHGASGARAQPFAGSAARAGPAGADPVTSFFTNLFGGGQSSQPQASAASRVATAQTPETTSSVTSVSAWSSATKVQPKPPARETNAKPEGKTRTARKAGRYAVQVAAVQKRADAEILLARLAKRHADVVQGREARIEPRAFGNMGTLYQVKVEGFASEAAVQPFCRKLRADGLDCLVIAKQ